MKSDRYTFFVKFLRVHPMIPVMSDKSRQAVARDLDSALRNPRGWRRRLQEMGVNDDPK